MIKYFDEVNAERVEEINSKEETRLRMRTKVNSHLDHTLTYGQLQVGPSCLGFAAVVRIKAGWMK